MSRLAVCVLMSACSLLVERWKEENVLSPQNSERNLSLRAIFLHSRVCACGELGRMDDVPIGMRVAVVLISLCCLSASAGPVEQWAQRRDAFRATLDETDHGSCCDWVRFSLLTWGAYVAADRQGRVRGWSAGQVNAFRHAVWQYQLARVFGDDAAAALGDTQERYSTDSADSRVDQHNNGVARAMYRFHRSGAVGLGEALEGLVSAVDGKSGLFDLGDE